MRASERPAPREEPRSPATAREPAEAPLLGDLQSLLSAATRRLVETGAGEAALAWVRRSDGAAFVAAAAYEERAPRAPAPGEFEALAALTRATRLDAPESPSALRALAARHGCALAAPIRPGEAAQVAVVLLLAGEPRPRALASLDAAASRLAAPVSAALAIARLRRLDAEVRDLDRLASLGRLAGEIVHEVRNPLVSIKTFLQLLPERRDDPELLDEFLTLANGELRRMERLLDLVIGQARPASDEAPREAEPVGVLEDTAELLRHHSHARGVQLRVDAAPGTPRAAAREDALRQVALNLALNAVDATPAGGSVSLRARGGERGVEISVCDSGPGIPEALRRAVFEPFFSTRGDRSGGLGLAIARRLVEDAGGTIAIEDGERGGALVRVRLPAAGEPRP